jgi:hypothetical protein
METSRVGPGEWIAAAGGVVLLIALFFLDWYSVEPNIAPLEIGASFLAQEPPTEAPPGLEIPQVDVSVDLNAWDEQGFLGTIANLVMLAAAVWAIVAVGLRAGAGQSPADPERVTAALGIAAAVMVLLRIIFPVGEIGGIDVDSSLKFGIFVALIGALLIALGGVMSRGATTAPARRAAAGEPPPPPPPSEPPPPRPSSEPPPPPPSR